MRKLLIFLIFLLISCENKENFTVRKNLNKVLNDFYKDGEFYSCSYDNKTYSRGWKSLSGPDIPKGLINNFQKFLEKDNYLNHQIFDEIILIYTKERIGLILSEPLIPWKTQRRIFVNVGDNKYSGLLHWGTTVGFKVIANGVEDYMDEKGDLKWEKFGLDYNDHDYDFNDEKEQAEYFSIVFKDNQLKVSFLKTYLDDYYRCGQLKLLTKTEKISLVKNFLDMFPRNKSLEELSDQIRAKYYK